MSATAASNPVHDTSCDYYDPNEVVPRNSPFLEPLRPTLRPSPSPPLLPFPKVSPPPSPGAKKSNRRKVKPSLGDAVLVGLLDGGRNPLIAQHSAEFTLASASDEELEDQSVLSESDCSSDSTFPPNSRIVGRGPGGDRSNKARGRESREPTMPLDPPDQPDIGAFDLKSLAAGALAGDRSNKARARESREPTMTLGLPDQPDMGAFDLKSLAAGALAVTAPDPAPGLDPAPPPEAVNAGPTPPVTEDDVMKEAPPPPPPAPLEIATRRIEPTQDGRPVQPAVPSPYSPRSFYSPRDSGSTPVPLKMDLTLSASGLSPSSHGEGLAPIQLNSPRSDTNGQTPLPSLTAALGDINQLESSYHAEKERMRNPHPAFPHSPPGLPRLPSMHSHHASPPISPAETFRRDPLSPNHSLASSVTSPRHGFYPQPNGHQPYDYPSSSAEPPTSDPSTATISERMSIEGLTSQSGSYVCNVDGCTAPPFQTQYLLNSHANVHSSARPHYCPVHGCTRSEGGKGFKRKNEMIRHGLVHDSPGYVCPFCPDREHKYPRPDNLQRHVRVHHVDKDKDDPQLRDVLAQRPDGPSRGRRRRGGPG